MTNELLNETLTTGNGSPVDPAIGIVTQRDIESLKH